MGSVKSTKSLRITIGLICCMLLVCMFSTQATVKAEVFDSADFENFNKSVMVWYSPQGGTLVDPISTKVGYILYLPEVSKEGHIFAGWYTDKECTDLWTSKRHVRGSMTLYAKWLPESAVTTGPHESGELDGTPTGMRLGREINKEGVWKLAMIVVAIVLSILLLIGVLTVLVVQFQRYEYNRVGQGRRFNNTDKDN